MRSRTLAAMAITFALGTSLMVAGCSQSPPPPTVDNTDVKPPKSVAATLGIETTITVSQLSKKLEADGLKVARVPTKQSGLFIPAKYLPLTADGAFVQTYRFKSTGEAKGAAGTVEAGGYVLGATPDMRVNVNWTGWPAFFRSGDLVVIFVTEKGKADAARDKRVYEALKSVLGAPFMGGNTPPPSAHTSGTPAATRTPSATGSAPATGSGG
jgi:hypothetical protein